MVYLFNSAYRGTYRKNVLNTLYLPNGLTNKYRYKIGQSVESDFDQKISNNERVIIIFIDRFHESGYYYYPLRLGKLQSIEKDGDYYFIYIIMDDLFHPKDISNFQEILKTSLSQEYPKADMNDRKNPHDGLYAFIDKDLKIDNDNYLYGSEAWTKAVDNISETDAFTNSENENILFLKANIDNTSISSNGIELTENVKYKLAITSRFPQNKNGKSPYSSLLIDEPNKLLSISSGKNMIINTFADHFIVSFVPKYMRDINDSEIILKTTNNNISTLLPDIPLKIHIKHSFKKSILIIILFILFAICSFVLSTDISICGISNNIIKLIICLIQGIVLFSLWRNGIKG